MNLETATETTTETTTETKPLPRPRSFASIVKVNHGYRVRVFYHKQNFDNYMAMVQRTGFMYEWFEFIKNSKEESEFIKRAMDFKEVSRVHELSIEQDD